MKVIVAQSRLYRVLWHVVLFSSICIFLALSFKLPFSGRSLIGNFDPFPDSFFYVVPPLKLLSTGRFETATRYGKIDQWVPPLYGVSLIPGYVLNKDPRTFYFTNLLLGIGSIVFLFLILKKATKSVLLTAFGSLLYVTQYGIYWQPQLAMAENLLIFLILLLLWVWQKPVSWRMMLVLVALAWMLFATKYVALPLTIGWLLLIVVRSWRSFTRVVFRKLFAGCAAISVFMVLLTTGFAPLLGAVEQITSQVPQAQLSVQKPSYIWLSTTNFATSFPAYGSMLLGSPTLHLWSNHRLIPPFFGLIGLIWMIAAVWRRWRNQELAWAILIPSTLQFVFLSLIAMVQSRYAYVFIPMIVLAVTMAVNQLRIFLQTRFSQRVAFLVVMTTCSILLMYHLFLSFSEIKTQLQVNVHQSEVAWWREGIVLADKRLQQEQSGKQKVLITALPPFLWDLYASPDLLLLPLHEANYENFEPVWGRQLPIGQTWLGYYQSLLDDPSVALYVSTSGFAAVDYVRFKDYQSTFELEQIMNECNDTCTVYRITKK